MVRHIVAWKHKAELSDSQKQEHALKIKAELEALPQIIDGIIELNVYTPLQSNDWDLLLNSLFESEEALAAYQIHPEHKKVSAFVRSVIQERACIDYNE